MELIFDKDLPLTKGCHALGGVPSPFGGIRGLKFWFVWEDIDQLQEIEAMLCTVTPLAPETLCYAEGSNLLGVGVWGPKF